ncbi:MAG: hypothetical protein R2844_06935 [Caldilineales bacterium]
MKTYTFHVNIPGTGRVWRKIEMMEDHTLEDLHWAIQQAFDFGGDHLYSFFMSGQAWDRATEYSLPEDAFEWDDDDDDEFDDEEFEPEIDEETEQAINAALGDAPQPESFEDMLNLISSNAELRGEMVKLMAKETGIPEFMADMLLKNANTLLGAMDENELDGMFAEDDLQGDVRETTLASLDLQPDQRFLYLFDYGDEWRFNVKLDKIGIEVEPGVEYPRIVEAVGNPPPQYPAWEDEDDDDDEAWDD